MVGIKKKLPLLHLFQRGKARSSLWLFGSMISGVLISIYGLCNICRVLNVILSNEILELELTLVVILFNLLILKMRQLRRETVLPLRKLTVE